MRQRIAPYGAWGIIPTTDFIRRYTAGDQHIKKPIRALSDILRLPETSNEIEWNRIDFYALLADFRSTCFFEPHLPDPGVSFDACCFGRVPVCEAARPCGR